MVVRSSNSKAPSTVQTNALSPSFVPTGFRSYAESPILGGPRKTSTYSSDQVQLKVQTNPKEGE